MENIGQDALEIYNLLSQVDYFWPDIINYLSCRNTNAEQLVWLILDKH